MHSFLTTIVVFGQYFARNKRNIGLRKHKKTAEKISEMLDFQQFYDL